MTDPLSVRTFMASVAQIVQTDSLRTLAQALGFSPPISVRKLLTNPREPVNLNPPDHAPRVPLRAGVSWEDPLAGTSAQAASFSLTLPNADGTTSSMSVPASVTSVELSEPLFFNKTYTWTVQSVNAAGTSNPVSASFSTPPQPAPMNLSPAAGETTVWPPPVLSWIDPGVEAGSGALEFQIVFSDGSASRTWKIGVTNFTVPLAVSPSTWYTWTVSGRYPGNTSFGPPAGARFQVASGGG